MFAIRAAKNVRVRNDTAEQHKHCTVGSFELKQCAKQMIDITRVMAPRPSPLIAALSRVAQDSKPTTAAKVFIVTDKFIGERLWPTSTRYLTVYVHNYNIKSSLLGNLSVGDWTMTTDL